MFICVVCRLCSSVKSPSNHLKDSLQRIGHVEIMAKNISTTLQRHVKQQITNPFSMLTAIDTFWLVLKSINVCYNHVVVAGCL